MPLAGEEQESADMVEMPLNVEADAARMRGDVRKCQEVRCLATPNFGAKPVADDLCRPVQPRRAPRRPARASGVN